MMWMSRTGDVDEVLVWHDGHCMLNCKFDQLHVHEPIEETGVCLADEFLLALPLGYKEHAHRSKRIRLKLSAPTARSSQNPRK